MKSKYKIIVSLLLAVSIIATILIFSRVWNIFNSYPEIKFNPFPIYLYLIVLFVASISFFIIIQNFDKINKKLTADKEELLHLLNLGKKIETKTDEEDIKIDIENIVRKLVPDDALLSDPKKYCETCLTNISKTFEIVQGIVYLLRDNDIFYPVATYAYYSNNFPSEFKLGETIPGQVAKDMKPFNLNNIPENYISVVSGLGQGSPRALFILPIIADNKTIAIFELASFKNFDKKTEGTFYKFANIINEKFKGIII